MCFGLFPHQRFSAPCVSAPLDPVLLDPAPTVSKRGVSAINIVKRKKKKGKKEGKEERKNGREEERKEERKKE